MSLSFADPLEPSVPLHVVEKTSLDSVLETLEQGQSQAARNLGFTGALGQAVLLVDGQGNPSVALAGYGDAKARARGRFHLAAAAKALPAGNYKVVGGLAESAMEEEALGWLLAGYAFDRYKSASGASARLVAPAGVNAARLEMIAAGEALTRDLINTPAADMGPDELSQAMAQLASDHGASFHEILGEQLLAENFPMIHAVGRASPRAPRLLDMRWGERGPLLTLVGKGVCFDTGGLNLKPGGSMGLMKKDMGGAATVLGLAKMIMSLALPLRLRVLVPAVENSVSGESFRPQDVLTARNGLTVEINNTDAEGRLVLADALALAVEDKPDLLVSMATLTGAARVAVGPDLAPYFTEDEHLAGHLFDAGRTAADPVWRLPFHAPYEAMIEPAIADLDNAPSGGFAGSITAALFLRRFAGDAQYVHFDIYGWQPAAAPARPKGGVGQGARALLAALPEVLGL